MPEEKLPWFMDDEIVNQLSTKYRNLALTQRAGYLAERRTPEEEERLRERIKQESLAAGSEWEEPEDDEEQQIIL